MAADFLPDRDAEFDAWAANFSERIAAAPGDYGLDAADAAALAAACTSWRDAYTLAASPATRTAGAVAAKNRERAALAATVRALAGVVRADPGVTAALKIGLGLRVRDAEPSPVPPPATCPLLSVSGMGAGRHTLRAADQATPAKRARPAGAAGLLVFRAVADGPVTDPEEGKFLAFVTRAEFVSLFTAADHGKTATYFARWANAKGQTGPWSPPASMPIAA